VSRTNFDELEAQIREDELNDAELITPVNYAKIRPISSPQIYAKIRNNKLQKVICPCGRTCINLREADEYFRKLRGELNWPYGTLD